MHMKKLSEAQKQFGQRMSSTLMAGLLLFTSFIQIFVVGAIGGDQFFIMGLINGTVLAFLAFASIYKYIPWGHIMFFVLTFALGYSGVLDLLFDTLPLEQIIFAEGGHPQTIKGFLGLYSVLLGDTLVSGIYLFERGRRNLLP